MGPRAIEGDRLFLILRAALLLAGVCTYLISPDDVVWRFIRTDPHRRALEHALFGIAAAILGLALLLKVKASAPPDSQDSRGPSRIAATVANLLQAIGIGSLLPLPGFLLLIVGDAVAILLFGRKSTPGGPGAKGDLRRARERLQALPWRDGLSAHIGLCFAFLSMVIFSVVLIDRVADVLFAMTALVSIAANTRALRRGYS
jgi:hypothetical protein